MEEIKSSFDKIFKQFQDNSLMYKKSTSLSFGCLNETESATELDSVVKKRKLSNGSLNLTPNQLNNTSILNISSPSLTRNLPNLSNISSSSSLNTSNASANASKWEIRMLKADILTYKTNLTQARKEIETRTSNHDRMSEILNDKINSMKKQIDNDEVKIKNLEKQLKQFRKIDSTQRKELAQNKVDMKAQKDKDAETIRELQLSKKELVNMCRSAKHDIDVENTNLKLRITELELNSKDLNTKIELLQRDNEIFKEKAKRCDSIENKLSDELIKMEMAQIKIRQLEQEIRSYGDWQETSKVFYKNLSRLQELEKDNERLQKDNLNLIENVNGKFLLEEENYHLKFRLEKYEKLNSEQISYKSSIELVEKELKDWKSICNDYTPTQNTPSSLRLYIQKLQKQSIILTSEKGESKLDKDSAITELQDMKKELQIYVKNNSYLQNNVRNHKNSITKLQKKLLLIAKERDCYKQLIENYEKDLTITGPQTNEINLDSQMRLRSEMVEKTLMGYKEMCNDLEKELQDAKSKLDAVGGTSIDGHIIASADNFNCCERIRRDLERVHTENERLRKRNDELDLILEQHNIKGAYEIEKFKVLHMSANPSSEAQENYTNKIEKLQAEVARLKRKNRKLEENSSKDQYENNNCSTEETSTDITVKIHEVGELKKEVQDLLSKNEHLRVTFREYFNRLQTICFIVFGYKLEQTTNSEYRVTSMYAENENDYLLFKIGDDGLIDILETYYFTNLSNDLKSLTQKVNSIPVFISNLTLELFNKTTAAF